MRIAGIGREETGHAVSDAKNKDDPTPVPGGIALVAYHVGK
jgi:hypothetical protein